MQFVPSRCGSCPRCAAGFELTLEPTAEFLHVKPGKGAAFVRSKLKNMKSGATVDKTFRAGEGIEVAQIYKADCQYSYPDVRSCVALHTSALHTPAVHVECPQEGCPVYVLHSSLTEPPPRDRILRQRLCTAVSEHAPCVWRTLHGCRTDTAPRHWRPRVPTTLQ